jgi:hypothetical protein
MDIPCGKYGSAKGQERIPSLGAAEHQEHHEKLALVGCDIRAVSSTIALFEVDVILDAHLGREAGGTGLCKGGRDGGKKNRIIRHPRRGFLARDADARGADKE